MTVKKIGFAGVGIMGKPMVRNLMKAGFEVHIFARTRAKVEDVIADGAVFHDSVSSLAGASEALITMVGFPSDVEEIYFGEGMILESAKSGTYLIDMTTTSPSLDRRIFEEGTARGFHVLDAPVTGGETGAVKGTLSILVGGKKEDFDACMEIFEAMGSNITYMGESGSGQHAKMANQIVIAGTIAGVSEAFAYAEKEGLDLQTLFGAISTGAAGSMQMSTCGKKMIEGDYSPGFRLKHFVKDMKIARGEAQEISLSLGILERVLEQYLKLEEEGLGDEGTQALIKYYDARVKRS